MVTMTHAERTMETNARLNQDDLRFFVTFHAVEQFQGRARDWLSERGLADDFATLKHLDGMCAAAEDAGRVEDFLDMGRPTRILDISGKDFGRLYALLRRNDSPLSKAEWAIVTVLTGQMYDRSKRGGGWRPMTAHEIPPPAPRVEYLKRVPPPSLPDAVAPPSAPMEAVGAPESVVPEAPSAESFCVVWTDSEGHGQYHEGNREDVALRMEQAHMEGGRSFALYSAVPLQVKTVFVF